MNIQQKVRIKYNKWIKYFLKSNFVGVIRLFNLAYENQENVAKRFKTPRYCQPKTITDNYSVIVNGKSFITNP